MVRRIFLFAVVGMAFLLAVPMAAQATEFSDAGKMEGPVLIKSSESAPREVFAGAQDVLVGTWLFVAGETDFEVTDGCVDLNPAVPDHTDVITNMKVTVGGAVVHEGQPQADELDGVCNFGGNESQKDFPADSIEKDSAVSPIVPAGETREIKVFVSTARRSDFDPPVRIRPMLGLAGLTQDAVLADATTILPALAFRAVPAFDLITSDVFDVTNDDQEIFAFTLEADGHDVSVENMRFLLEGETNGNEFDSFSLVTPDALLAGNGVLSGRELVFSNLHFVLKSGTPTLIVLTAHGSAGRKQPLDLYRPFSLRLREIGARAVMNDQTVYPSGIPLDGPQFHVVQNGVPDGVASAELLPDFGLVDSFNIHDTDQEIFAFKLNALYGEFTLTTATFSLRGEANGNEFNGFALYSLDNRLLGSAQLDRENRTVTFSNFEAPLKEGESLSLVLVAHGSDAPREEVALHRPFAMELTQLAAPPRLGTIGLPLVGPPLYIVDDDSPKVLLNASLNPEFITEDVFDVTGYDQELFVFTLDAGLADVRLARARFSLEGGTNGFEFGELLLFDATENRLVARGRLDVSRREVVFDLNDTALPAGEKKTFAFIAHGSFGVLDVVSLERQFSFVLREVAGNATILFGDTSVSAAGVPLQGPSFTVRVVDGRLRGVVFAQEKDSPSSRIFPAGCVRRFLEVPEENCLSELRRFPATQYVFTALNEDSRIEAMDLQVPEENIEGDPFDNPPSLAAARSILEVTLQYRNALGETVQRTAPMENGVAALRDLDIFVPKDGDAVVEVFAAAKLEMNPDGSSGGAMSGDPVRLGLSLREGAVFEAVALETGNVQTEIHPRVQTSVPQHTVRATLPTVLPAIGMPLTIQDGSQPLYGVRFFTEYEPFLVHRLVFELDLKLDPKDEIGHFKLFVNGQNYTYRVQIRTEDGTDAKEVVDISGDRTDVHTRISVIIPPDESGDFSRVLPGSPWVYELKAELKGISGGEKIGARVLGDDAPLETRSINDTWPMNFAWREMSDISVPRPGEQRRTRNFINGYGVRFLPTSAYSISVP